jgi:hypothetical protein
MEEPTKEKDKTMKMNKKVSVAAAGLMAAYMTAATASAQTHMVFEYGASAGTVSGVSVANLKPNWVVTGVRNGSNDMELIVWESLGTSLKRQGSATGPMAGVGNIATVALSSSRVITAAVSNSGLLELTSWSVSSSGTVTAGSTTEAESAANLSMTGLDSSHVVVAFSGLNGWLQLDLFSVSANGTIAEESSAFDTGGAAVTSVTALGNGQIVTAVQDAFADLYLVSWSVSNAFSFQNSALAGNIRDVSITSWGSEGHVATALSNSAGDLEVIDWSVNPTTGAITREGSVTKVTASQVAATTIGRYVFTGVVDSHGKVDAGVWGYNGSSFIEAASAEQEAITAVSVAPLSSGNQSVTASRTSSGDLRVDVWESY